MLGDTTYPFYVLGQKEESATRSLLLVATAKVHTPRELKSLPTRLGGSIQIWDFPTAAVDAYESAVQGRLGQPYTKAELSSWATNSGQFYDQKDHTFTISWDSPRSSSASSLSGKGVNTAKYNHLPTQVFLAYDVLGEMGKLATRFDVVEQTDRLLDRLPAFE